MAGKKKLTRAQKLRHPATRSKLPMSALSSTQQMQRKRNRRIASENANPLYDPSAILSGPALRKAAQQLTNEAYRPRENALGRELTNTTTQGTALADRSSGYYRKIAEGEAAAVARTKALNDLLRGNVKAIGDNTQQALDKTLQDEQQHVQSRGLSQGSTHALDELAALKANATVTSGAEQTRTEKQAANSEDYTGAFYRSQGARGAEVNTEMLNRLANQQGEIRAKQSDLRAGKGDDFVKQLLGLRQSGFENAATAEGLGIKRSDLRAQTQNQIRADKTRNRQISETAKSNKASRAQAKVLAGQRVTQQERNSLRSAGINPDTGKPIPGGKLDPKAKPTKQEGESATSLKMRTDISTGRGTFRRLLGKFGGDEAHVKKHMIEVMGVPPAAYNAIYDLERRPDHRLHPRNVRALETDLGVMVPQGWKGKARKKTAAAKAPR